jgi:AraC-like DNA-binding protein
MDALSEVLRTVTLDSALYYHAEFSAPWCVRAPASSVMGPRLTPGAGHVIIFHVVLEGRAYAAVDGGARIQLDAGNVVIFPRGDPHIMGNGRSIRAVDAAAELDRVLSQGLKVSRMGGGGEVTRIVCGYLVSDLRLGQALLSGLPRLLTVNIRSDSAGRWLEDAVLRSVREADSLEAGGKAVLSKLSELVFVETLRRYIAELPACETGWLAGVRDDHVGRALAIMHRHPGHPWTIARLAEGVGVSRSVFAERFKRCVGEPPMSYLARWRLRSGARLLSTTSWSVARTALEVGYESEAAFNRAFKREFGSPPARYRNLARAAREIGGSHDHGIRGQAQPVLAGGTCQ